MKSPLLFMVFSLAFASCQSEKRVEGVYRYSFEKQGRFIVSIVDGSKIRQNIYKEFVYGGNEQRYPFVPKGEIWIDNAISSEEYELTVRHELNERHLMAKFAMTYQAAHDSSLALELTIRHRNESICSAHESSLGMVSVRDYNGKKEIQSIPDSIRLQNIYRIPMGNRKGISIWVVDGYRVRKTFFPDFGFSGNDLSCHFIPKNEIWIDGQISCEETEYSIATELIERKLISEGKSYDDAYETAIESVRQQRVKMADYVGTLPKIAVPDSLDRDTGILDPNEN
ncbi:MAG: hypothetical protein WCP85_03050 [Mariniphaga sp.]